MQINSKAGQILSYSFHVVPEDGVINAEELAFMTNLALEDKVVDEEEKRVLKLIFDRPNPRDLSREVRRQMTAFRIEHGF